MQEQIAFYEAKLAYETDSWDLNEMRRTGENVVVIDARSEEAEVQRQGPDPGPAQ